MLNHTFIKRSLAVALAAAAGAFPAAAQAEHIVQPVTPAPSAASVPSIGPSLAVVHQLNQLQGNVRQTASSARVPSIGRSLAVAHQLNQLQGNVRQLYVAEGRRPSTQLSSGTPSALPSAGSGFQWGDAGIGAAGAVVLLGASGLGAVAMRRRHPRTLAS